MSRAIPQQAKDVLAAARLVRNEGKGHALSHAVADYLEAIGKYWGNGWLPSEPSPADKATIAIARAVLASYSTKTTKGTDHGSKE